MKLTLTTLVIIEDTSDNCNEMSLCYHSFQEDPNRAKSEIIAAVNGVYAPDRVFNTIEEIQEYFEYVHLESQEIKQQPPPLRTHKITDKRNITNPTKRYNHNRYNITTMKKKDLIYIPHQDTWTEHFPNPGSNKNDYTLYLSDPQAQYNKLLRTQQKLRNKKK